MNKMYIIFQCRLANMQKQTWFLHLFAVLFFFFFLNHVLGNGFLKVAAIKDVLNVVSGIHQCFAFQEINLVLACII